MIRLARHYIDALQIRLFLIDEYLRTRKAKNVGSSLLRAILRNPSGAEDWVNLLRFLDPDEELLAIDIGANVGAFTADMLTYFPKARSVCFEPCAEPFEVLSNRFEGDSRVECHRCAIGSEHQTREMYVQTGASHYNSFHRYENDTNRFYDIDYQNVEEVACRRLDEFDLALEGTVFLKVDTQGHEVDVLRGAGPVLDAVDVALTEVSFANEYEGLEPSFPTVAQILREHGLYQIIFQGFGGQMSNYPFERDVVFARKELLNNVFFHNY